MWHSNGSFLNHTGRSGNISGECQTFSDGGAQKVAKVLGYSIIMLVSLLGNSLVVFIVLKTKDLRGTINYLIMNMAVSDLIIPIFVIPRQIANIAMSMNTGGWLVSGVVGDVLCKTLIFLQDLSTAVSVQTLVLITMERFVAVVYPMKVKLITQKKRAVFMALTWIIGSLAHSPYFYAMKTKKNEIDSNVYCVLNWEPVFDHRSTHRLYTTIVAVIFIFVPFALIAVLYMIILLKLNTRGRNRYQSGCDRKTRRKENRNVLLMAITIVLVFALCWAPFNIFIFMYIFVWNFQIPCVSKNIEFVAYFFAYSIPAINPCLYFIFVKKYKEALKRCFVPVLPVKRKSCTEVETLELRESLRPRELENIIRLSAL